MYSVSVRDHMMVAHSLKGDVFGPAQRLHGATFVVDVEFRRSNTEHRQENAALIGIVRVGGDDPPGLACGAVGQRLNIADFAGVRFSRHDTILSDADIRSQPSYLAWPFSNLPRLPSPPHWICHKSA